MFSGVSIYEIAFLNRMAISFILVIAVMLVITMMRPLANPKILPVREGIDMKPAASVKWLGILVIAITIALYIIFW